MEEIKNVPNIKKIIVELDNGKKLEFDKQFALFAQDEMSVTEKSIHGDDFKKICGIISCKSDFAASVAGSLLKMLNEKTPGLDHEVVMKHLVETDDFARLLVDALG